MMMVNPDGERSESGGLGCLSSGSEGRSKDSSALSDSLSALNYCFRTLRLTAAR